MPHREDSPWHERALSKVTSLANSGQYWAVTWSSCHEFFAIVTHPKIYRPATPLATALAAMEAWQKSPGLRMLNEGPGYFEAFA